MNLVHLKYLCEVEKYGSISKAAESLYIYQPGLSKIIRDMEEEMNIKIFERTSKGVKPTKNGKIFLNQARKILEEVDILEGMYGQQQENITFNISVPRASYISTAFIDYLSRSKTDHYTININYHETNSIDTIKNVYECEDNLGIIRFPIEEEEYYLSILKIKNLTYNKILEFDYQILMSKENPLAKKVIYFKDLYDQIELIHGDVSLPQYSSSTNLINKKSASRVINIYERGSQFEILKKIKNSYLWVSPIPKVTLEQFSLTQKKCQDMQIRCKDLFIYRKGYKLSIEDKKFLQCLENVINDINITSKA